REVYKNALGRARPLRGGSGSEGRAWAARPGSGESGAGRGGGDRAGGAPCRAPARLLPLPRRLPLPTRPHVLRKAHSPPRSPLRPASSSPSSPSVRRASAKASTDHTKMPSQMEHAMETMMFTFHKFAGDKGYLTKEDLRVLMEKEFPGFLENQKDPLAVDKIMKDLDQCRDGKVGFQSFFSLIAGLTIACNDYFVVHMKQKGKK
uniref:Protein S100-A10 n=1 Tax=Gorilla gorilla gorilla TaxID=9595 RepID=G3S8W2_GORGO